MVSRPAAVLLSAALLVGGGPLSAQPDTVGPTFSAADVFDLEWATNPRLSPDGGDVVYVRNSFDADADSRRSELWRVRADATGHRPVDQQGDRVSSPRWSPTGDRIAWVAQDGDEYRIRVRWTETGEGGVLARLSERPGGLAWSPDGARIAFSMFVPEEEAPYADLPARPDGADWGPSYRFVDEVRYRADGRGSLRPGQYHLFVLSSEGGTPVRVAGAGRDPGAQPRWTSGGRSLVFSANRHADAEYRPLDTEVYEVALSDGRVRALTDRRGPDESPAVSPDGQRIAYTGFDDRNQGYQVSDLYVVDRDGGEPRLLTGDLDRGVRDPAWSANGRAIWFLYDDEGVTRLAFVSLEGEVTPVTDGVGGTVLGRPYASGSFTAGSGGRFAFTHTAPDHPADVAVGVPTEPGGLDPTTASADRPPPGGHGARGPSAGTAAGPGRSGGPAGPRAAGEGSGRQVAIEVRRVTHLNDDVLGNRRLAEVEEVRFSSSHDGREIQGWLMKPPGFDPARSYPLLLEIHGGPFANYGVRFAAELQLYAAAGYLVLYVNPRGSTGYGEEFGNLIHHAYPGRDYDDLMSGVDGVTDLPYVDGDRLFVTGGSGGGVLTAWIVGRTDRFRAAVAQKPVINWYSFVLTADQPVFFSEYWFPGPPWEHRDHYLERSPVSLVGNVATPVMLITGEEDLRTPISETEQFYQALRLREVDAAMVRIPDASHHIAARPSNLVGKVAHVLAWFAEHGGEPRPEGRGD